MRRTLCAAAVIASLSGCRWVRTGDPGVLRPVAATQVKVVGDCGAATCRDSLDIVAMGVSGFLIIPWRDSTQLVMTPPSYTNPTLWWTFFGNWLFGSHPNSARIERRLRDLPAANKDRLRRVRGVLVGHGHYDHVMDLTYLARYLPNATVFGSNSVVNTLHAVREFDGDLKSVDSLAGTSADSPGTSFSIGHGVRVRAIAWAHAPNFGNHVIAEDEVTTPATSLPRGLFGWKLGRVYAYAIDIDARDGTGGVVGARIFVHDAAAPPDVVRRASDIIGTLPSARSTIAIVTVANYDQSPSYPALLLERLAPDHVLLGHWEDFFRSPEKAERVARGIPAKALIDIVQRFQGDRWSALRAGAVLRVRY